jgi:hypothetical protein
VRNRNDERQDADDCGHAGCDGHDHRQIAAPGRRLEQHGEHSSVRARADANRSVVSAKVTFIHLRVLNR